MASFSSVLRAAAVGVGCVLLLLWLLVAAFYGFWLLPLLPLLLLRLVLLLLLLLVVGLFFCVGDCGLLRAARFADTQNGWHGSIGGYFVAPWTRAAFLPAPPGNEYIESRRWRKAPRACGD